MKLSVTSKHIAEHLIKEFGHDKALRECEERLKRCLSPKTCRVWNEVGYALQRRS